MRWLPGSLATPQSQPFRGSKVATSNPMTRGLRAAVLPIPGGLWEAVGGVLLRPPNTSVIAANPRGIALSQTAGNANGISLGRSIALPNNQLTVITVATLRDGRTNNDAGFLYDCSASSGTGRYLIYKRGFGGTPTARSYGFYAGGTAIQEGDTGLIGLMTTGSRNVIAAVHNGNSHQIYKDGRLLQSWTVSVTYGAFTPTLIGNWSQTAIEGFGGELEAQLYFDRALAASEIAAISANPWQLFEQSPRPLWAPEPVATVYRPGSDITANGWTATPSGSLFERINESTLDTGDYITSPNLTNAVTLGWDVSVPTGTNTIRINAQYLGTTGQLRVVMLDSGGSSVGNTSWQALTASAATYELTVTTTGISTQFRIEVQ